MNILNMIRGFVVILLVILFFISLARFIYTILKNQKEIVVMSREINQKLDQIIKYLEKKNADQ